ncbi:MAG: hypothetical protein OEQ14_15765 [Gammaproteobacteria bacterium]|nr:hypothetical protein [Gammaproteobacteria bacterium]
MRTRRPFFFSLLAMIAMLGSLPDGELLAHGGGNWTAFTIDGVDDNARVEVLKVQSLVSEVIRGRADSGDWPLETFRPARDALLTVKEEVDEILEHYAIDGVNLQLASDLKAEPRAGRTVAASRALDAGIALLDRAASLDNSDSFVKEFYGGGMAARLYELLEAQVDRMDLYAILSAGTE